MSLSSQSTDGGNFHWVVGKLKKVERTANISLTGVQDGDGRRFLSSLGWPYKENPRDDVAIPDLPTLIPNVLVFRLNCPESKQHQTGKQLLLEQYQDRFVLLLDWDIQTW